MLADATHHPAPREVPAKRPASSNHKGIKGSLIQHALGTKKERERKQTQLLLVSGIQERKEVHGLFSDFDQHEPGARSYHH